MHLKLPPGKACHLQCISHIFSPSHLGEGGQKKTEKKLTNVSLVCMYVGRKSEMSVFFPTEVIYRLFQWSLRKKTEKCQFLWSMYVCKAKTDICQIFFLFFFVHLPPSAAESKMHLMQLKCRC